MAEDEGIDVFGWLIKWAIFIAIFRSCSAPIVETVNEVKTDVAEVVEKQSSKSATDIRKMLPNEFEVYISCPRCKKDVEVRDISMLLCSYCQYTLIRGEHYK